MQEELQIQGLPVLKANALKRDMKWNAQVIVKAARRHFRLECKGARLSFNGVKDPYFRVKVLEGFQEMKLYNKVMIARGKV